MGSSPTSPCVEIGRRFHAGLAALREAYEYAGELERSVWDFAVEIQVLRATGMTNSDLRWLVCRELVEHASEITRDFQATRAFRPTGMLTFTKRTCFVLTETGAVHTYHVHGAAAQSREPEQPRIATTCSPPVPEWDKERQELRLEDHVVKHFKVPAPNQELILASFQEECWPPRIDDPLPPHPDQNAKRRLHDTICTLNRHQIHRLIRFSGDGSGEGVRWDRLIPQAGLNGSQ
jgi:hypothetical protein